jgi:hypothetical protein
MVHSHMRRAGVVLNGALPDAPRRCRFAARPPPRSRVFIVHYCFPGQASVALGVVGSSAPGRCHRDPDRMSSCEHRERAAKPNRQHRFQAEQPPHDDRAVGPRTGPRDDQPIPTRPDRITVPPVRGDTGGDVVGDARELAGLGDVCAHIVRMPTQRRARRRNWPDASAIRRPGIRRRVPGRPP